MATKKWAASRVRQPIFSVCFQTLSALSAALSAEIVSAEIAIKKSKRQSCLLLDWNGSDPYFPDIESETVSRFLPFALLRESTFRPFLVFIRALKPCLFFLFLLDG